MRSKHLLYPVLLLGGAQLLEAKMDPHKIMSYKMTSILKDAMAAMQTKMCRPCVDLCVDEEAARQTTNNPVDQAIILERGLDKLVVSTPLGCRTFSCRC